MHQVERALFDIRRGLPVVLSSQSGWTLVHALEAGDGEALASMQALSGTRPGLLLARRRLAALGAEPGFAGGDVARLRLPAALSAAQVAELAFGTDPSVARRRTDLLAGLSAADDAERAGFALTRRALLLPAALTARVAAERLDAVGAAVAEGELLSVPVEQAADCIGRARGMLKRVSEARVPLAGAPNTRFVLFREPDGLREHVAVLIGEPGDMDAPVPLRLHSACLTGDLFDSLRCDCGEQLRNAVAEINALGGGVLLYLAQEGRGIGLANKFRAYALQDAGLDTLDADQMLGFDEDERHYGVAVDMLSALGVRQARLLTNNPDKLRALAEGGIEITERQGVYGRLNDHNRRYLNAKASRAGHFLDEILGQRSRQD